MADREDVTVYVEGKNGIQHVCVELGEDGPTMRMTRGEAKALAVLLLNAAGDSNPSATEDR
jgi:hypothetical protein